MSAGRYRGLFWAPDADPIPGTLEITDSGSINVELLGRLREGQGSSVRDYEASRIEGEIAGGSFPGHTVTLFDCLKTKSSFGPGGPTETWLASRTLIGNDSVGSGAVFERVTIGLRGLAAFIWNTPRLWDIESKSLQPDLRTEIAQFTVDDWRVTFGWRTSGQESTTELRMSQSPFIEVELKQPCSVDGVLRDVVPVFEALLTVALQEHARLEEITVRTSQAREAYRVLGPRVEANATPTREPHVMELLFRLKELPGAEASIKRVRSLFSQHPEFTAVFLGHERARKYPYVEDFVRISVLTLAQLTQFFPAASTRAAEWLAALDEAPPQVKAFLPSASLVAVPELVRELLTPRLCQALRVESLESFVESIGPAFRWATLREGTQTPTRDLLRLHHQLRALVHLCLLRYLGFEPSEAERRMVQAIEQRVLPS